MAPFILVAGAMHTAWVWHRLAPLLEAAGHEVWAPDLPGLGEDNSITPAEMTLSVMADFVVTKVRKAEERVILVGHSRGGQIIGETAERVPELIEGLIYVTAILAQPGQSAFAAMGVDPNSAPIDLAPGGVMSMPAEIAKPMFYNRCSFEDAAEAGARLFPEGVALCAAPSGATWERWGKLPRAYIECSDDNTLPLARQRIMQAGAPCNPVFTLDADHSPFLSATELLTAAILSAARDFATRP